MNCPYQYTKQVASHFGGTRNSMALSWPAEIGDAGGIRSQFTHVVDFVPTNLEIAGLPEPSTVNGVAQKPLEGTSMTCTFGDADADADERHVTQYFEMFGNRGIYHEGWTAVTRHSLPWYSRDWPSFDADVWELDDTTTDWSQGRDLSGERPDKLRELQALFLIEASKLDVFPLDDRVYERFNAAVAGRPDLPAGRTTMTFYPGTSRMMENTVLNIKNRSHSVTAEVEVSAGATDGVLVAQGGRFAGWSLYVKGGRASYAYNWFDMDHTTIEAAESLPAGVVIVRFHFDFDGAEPGAGGRGRLYVNDELAGEGRIERTVPFVFSAAETLDIGKNLALPVTEAYPEGHDNAFQGDQHWVRIDLEDDDVSHLEPEETRYNRIMARQ